MPPTVLVLSPEYPYPDDSGSKLAIASNLALLHEAGWRIVLVVVTAPEQAAALTVRPAAPFAMPIHVISRQTRYTMQVETELEFAIQMLIDQERPSLIWAEYASFAPLLNEVETRGAAVWFHSINFELMHRWEKSGAYLRENVHLNRAGVRLIREHVRLLSVAYQWERQMHQVADRVWYISNREKQLLPRLYGRHPIPAWLPPLLDRPAIAIQDHAGPLNVLYMGSRYDDFPNRSGALYLLQTLIPALNAAYPDTFHFHLTGKFAREHLADAVKAPNITLHDYVPHLPTLIEQTDLFCLPVRMGWGCKLKMLEGLAYGIPVIGAWQVFRGVPSEPGLYAACDSIDDYVKAFGKLRDGSARRAMGEAGRHAYQQWSEAAKDELFRALAAVNPYVKHKRA
jgi:glycosyltransferase involved in cell wall biosynthesis